MIRHDRRAGFTLVEVMLALAILGMGLTLLVKTLASNVSASADAEMMGVVANLARGKMYDVEETLRKDGFQETDQSSRGDFADEGWPDVTWDAKVEIPEVPGLATLQQVKDAQAGGKGDGKGTGADSGSEAPAGGYESSGFAGIMAFMGADPGAAAGAGDAGDQMGAAVMQQYFDMVQQVFKASIRKVTLTVRYEPRGNKREFTLDAYFTDDAAMEKVLFMLNAVEDKDDKDNPPPPPENK